MSTFDSKFMPEGSHPKEELINEFVGRYMHKHIQQGTSSGMTQEAMEQSMEVASFILTIKMLRNYYGGNLPAGHRITNALAEVMQETPEQAKEILMGFQQRGWLSEDLEITAAGDVIAGEDLEC